MANPKENRTQPAFIFIEQFRRKGYNCRELKEAAATVLILTHEKKQVVASEISQSIGQAYKTFLRLN